MNTPLTDPDCPHSVRDQINGGVTQEAQIKALEEENARLEDELSDARYQPWPEWATKVLAVIRKRSGYDGYHDAYEGVDLPAELEEAFHELEQQAERASSTNQAEREQLEAALRTIRDMTADDPNDGEHYETYVLRRFEAARSVARAALQEQRP